jgi:hypothetical protein
MICAQRISNLHNNIDYEKNTFGFFGSLCA